MTEGARYGRPPCLARETVVRTVLEVGSPQLTFTTVRERLEVGENTSFRYAPDRDELVRLGLGLAMGSVEIPSWQGPWRQVFTNYVVFAQRFWEVYSGSVTEVSRGVFTLVMVRLSDEPCSFLMECGLAVRNALPTCDLVFGTVVDSRRRVEYMDGLSAETDPKRDDMRRQRVPDEPEENPVPGWEKIRQAELRAVNLPPFDWSMRKLEAILAGVATSLAPRE